MKIIPSFSASYVFKCGPDIDDDSVLANWTPDPEYDATEAISEANINAVYDYDDINKTCIITIPAIFEDKFERTLAELHPNTQYKKSEGPPTKK